MRKNRKRGGFSLIELLVTVAVVLVIAAIAVPNYVSSRMAANESSAVASLRAISSALVVYTTNYPAIGYPPNLVSLSNGGASENCASSAIPSSSSACLLDGILGQDPAMKSGYRFTYSPDNSQTPSGGYTIHADPITRGFTGRRSFFMDQPGVIRWNATAPATSTDLPIPI